MDLEDRDLLGCDVPSLQTPVQSLPCDSLEQVGLGR